MRKFIAILICILVLISCCVISVSAEDTLPYEIEGVELLSTETTSHNTTGIIIWIVWFSILAVVNIGGIIAILVSDNDNLGTAEFLVIIFLCIALVVCVIGIVLNSIDLAFGEPTTTYKVTISDSVDYVKFTEHYEEINREGKIYTIKERK